MIVNLTVGEARAFEDAVREEGLESELPLHMDAHLHAPQYKALLLKLSRACWVADNHQYTINTEDTIQVDLTEDEVWVGIRLVSVYRSVGQQAVGMTLKKKLYSSAREFGNAY